MRQRALITIYGATAVLVRGADAGAIVGVVLLTAATPGAHALTGVLAAALTAPHLAGPVVAPILDRSAHPRGVLSGSFALYGVSIVAAALWSSSGAVTLGVLALVVAGACGPLVTGGLSSGLTELARADATAQRRAQGIDALTYGFAAAVGPGVVTVAAAAGTPLIALVLCGTLALVAAGLVLLLPRGRRSESAARKPDESFWRAAATVFTIPSLRRATVCTSMTALAVGSVPVLAVAGVSLHSLGGAAAGALLVCAFGLGTLAGSLLLTLRPLRGSAERVVFRSALGIAAGFAFCGFAPVLWVAVLGYACVGVASAMQFTASLAVRAESSPPGLRAQVFMTMAGIKVALASVGIAVAGSVTSAAPAIVLSAAAIVPAAAWIAAMLDRRSGSAQSLRSRATSPRGPTREQAAPPLDPANREV